MRILVPITIVITAAAAALGCISPEERESRAAMRAVTGFTQCKPEGTGPVRFVTDKVGDGIAVGISMPMQAAGQEQQQLFIYWVSDDRTVHWVNDTAAGCAPGAPEVPAMISRAEIEEAVERLLGYYWPQGSA